MRFLCLLLFIPVVLLAQSTYPTAKGWQELTISNGLSQGMIFDLVQDRKGFIWVATKDGLNRYDGYNFTVFTHDPYDKFSLSDNSCSALLVDSRGWLWVGTLNRGLDLFDTRNQRFYHIDIRDQGVSNSGNYAVDSINEDAQGTIWVTANYNKLFRISLGQLPETGLADQPNLTSKVQIRQVSIDDRAGGVSYLSFRPDGRAVAACATGWYTFNWKYPALAGRFTPYTNEFAGVFASYGQANQDSWFATRDNEIIYYRQGSRKTIIVPETNAGAISLKAIDATTIAITTSKFLWLMSPDELFREDSLTVRTAFSTMPPDLYAITQIIRDQTGNIWFGTSGYGVRKFNPRIKQFHSSLSDKTLSYLYADRQRRIYVRHEFAYEQIDPGSGELRPFLSDNLPPADKRQRYLMQDRQGTFWVSNVNFQTHEMHLFKFSAEWKLLKKYPLPPNASFGFYNNQTIEDADGRLWIGATNGKLLRFDPLTETFRVFSYQSLLPQKSAEIETYALYFDSAGTLWIGTPGGLIRADHPRTNPTFFGYKNNVADQQSLSNDFVLSLLDDPIQPNRYLWVGTKGSGLDRLDKQSGEFDHITEKQGLPNRVVYGILSDETRNLWLSTNRGLAQFNPKTRTFRTFTKGDGLQDDEFNTGSFFKTPSGKLLFGGVHGLTAFRARDVVRTNERAPQARIIGLKVNNEPVKVGDSDNSLAESIDHATRIELAHDQNGLTFEFSMMDFTNSAQNRYRYKLEGIDNDWVEAGTNRFANYAQLPDGNYTLLMVGSADGEVWSKPVELQIRVYPPFYRTWWAYLLYALALTFAGWQLYRFQTQRLLLQQQVDFEQKEASRLAELDTLKTQFFANISHEFRTPLTLILGPVEQAAQDYAHDPRFPLIQRNANRLLGLINQILDLSKLEAGQLRPEPEWGDVAAFFRILASSFHSLAESRQIRFTFSQNETGRQASFDRDKLEKIVTNLLSNAFKFTPAGKEVRMHVAYGMGTLQCTIEDTGVGIPPEHVAHIFERFYQQPADGKANRPYEGTGIGLALVHELVKVLDGTVEVVSTEGAGTTFTVVLPLVFSEAPIIYETGGGGDNPSIFSSNGNDQTLIAPAFPERDPNPSATTSDNVLLIVDDNTDIRVYVRSIFEADYQILEAEDGQTGLERATASLPTIVICDLMMPRLDGFDFCRALKAQEATSHIPVVMLTAKATAEDRIEGFELGADDYLTKPFNRVEIQTRVRNLIRQRERMYRRFATETSVPPGSEIPILPQAEQQFLDRLRAVVVQHLDQPDFSVEELAEEVAMSRTQLHRKLKAVDNTTATFFIRDIRLAKAAELLTKGDQSVTQVALAVGFDNLSYFAKVFQEQYGILPSQYGKAIH